MEGTDGFPPQRASDEVFPGHDAITEMDMVISWGSI